MLNQFLRWIDVVPKDFLLVLKCAMKWVSISFPAVPVLLYFTRVLLVVGHIYFLCNGNGGVFALVLLVFWCFFLLFPLMVELPGWEWEVFDLFP